MSQGESTTQHLAPLEKSVSDFLTMLRNLGVNRFEGYGIKVDFGEIPTVVAPKELTAPKMVDLGGGLMVSEQDARDLGLEDAKGQ